MKSPPDRISFEKELTKNGITVLFRENEQGRIYGATFIDHEQKTVFNGSRLGKEFSANVFNEQFGNERNTNMGSQADLNTHPENERQTAQAENRSISHGRVEDVFELVGNLFSVILPEHDGRSGDIRPAIRNRKKKKRKYGRQT